MISAPGGGGAQSAHVISYVLASILAIGLLVLLFMMASYIWIFYLDLLPKADEWIRNTWRDKLTPYPVPNLMTLGIFLIAVLLFVPWIHSWLMTEGLGKKEVLEVANETRKTVAQIMAGMAAIIAFHFAWQRNYLTAQGQITDRFSKAVEQLGSDQITIRMGGIFALERIARDSPEDHWSVMEVLTAFIREKSPANPREEEETFGIVELTDAASIFINAVMNMRYKGTKPSGDTATTSSGEARKEEELPELPKDIQAALTVIGNRGNLDLEEKNEDYIDLCNSDLRNSYLYSAKLQGAFLTGTLLQGADLTGARLQGADLTGAQLQGANMRMAQLQGADMSMAQLQGAYLFKTKLQGALLTDAHLQGAIFVRASLQGARFTGADISGCCFADTNILGTIYESETNKYLAKEHYTATLPDDIKKKIFYCNELTLLTYRGIMSEQDKLLLLTLSKNESYIKTINALFEKSQQPHNIVVIT